MTKAVREDFERSNALYVNKYRSKWKAENAQIAIDYIGAGHSLEALAGYFGVARGTIFQWRDRKPEFAEAIEIGTQKRRAFVEEKLLQAMHDRSMNAAIAIFIAKNWAGMRDDLHHALTGDAGGPIILSWIHDAKDRNTVQTANRDESISRDSEKVSDFAGS